MDGRTVGPWAGVVAGVWEAFLLRWRGGWDSRPPGDSGGLCLRIAGFAIGSRTMETNAAENAPDVRAIAAVSRNGVIGADGRLPWHLPEDVAYLHEQVAGGAVVEGRRCYESRETAFPGARATVVLSGRADWNPPDATVCPSIPAAIAEASARGRPVWIAGGERVYAEGLPYCGLLHLTLIDADFEGDTFFPDDWRERFPVELYRRESRDGGLSYAFLVLAARGFSPTGDGRTEESGT